MSERRDSQSTNPRRDLALRVAVGVISERGVAQTRYRDVAEASGVPVATLQYMFGSRENLLAEALDASSQADLRESRALVAAIDDPVEQLHAFLSYNTGAHDGEGDWRMWLEFWHVAVRDPGMLERSYMLQLAWRGLIAEILDRGRGMGRFNADLDSEQAAIQVLAAVDGIVLALLLQTPEPDHELARRLAFDAVDRIVRPG